ncbi:hypothetical protein H7X68_03120 [Candidatus Saccharibacteria bacterium]|nr:hypothetical protein [Candidatus Saccharibacteria bacterium]
MSDFYPLGSPEGGTVSPNGAPIAILPKSSVFVNTCCQGIVSRLLVLTKVDMIWCNIYRYDVHPNARISVLFILRMETPVNSPLLSEVGTMLTSQLFWLVFATASFTAYAMYIVAYVFESRLPGRDVPVWRGQSKAFMPGDFGLSLLVAVGVFYYGDVTADWTGSNWFKMLSIVVGVVTFLVSRQFLYTQRDYSWQAWCSPSKRYHDFVMFLLFCAVALYICLPSYLLTSWTETVLSKLLGLLGLAIWVVGNVYDFTHGEVPNDRQHPSVYQPIWVKWRRTAVRRG